MRLRTLIAACAAALFLVAGAGTAQAADFVVNSTGDASDNFRGDGVCADSGGQCTFRAALDESEYGYRYGDGRTTIFFGPMFDGQATDRVVISRPLEVPYKTTIEGGNCGSGGLPKPCVWVGYPSPSNQAVITTSFDPIIAGLAIGNGAVGIQTTMQEGILARNWLGIALDGSATPNGIGINSGTSYGGVIGGGTLSQGNFIVGGDIGMIAQAVQNYQGGGVINNTIGVNPVTGQPQGATSFGLTGNGSGFYGNTVGVKSGTAVQIGSGTFGDGFVGVDRLGRDIGGGSVGIRFGGASGTPGYGSISGDTIGDVDGPGILIQSGQASIQGNHIGVDANGGAHPNAGPGILSPGGDASAFTSQFGSSPFGHSSIGDPGYQCCYPPVNTTPNVISNSGGPAISIIGDENDDNAVGENLGQNNAGGFIDLGGDGPGNRTGVNHGISAPMIQGASLTHAYGRGNQFSLVFAYLSAPGPHGDLISVLGKIDKYNTAGHWEFDYPPQPPGTVLAFGSFGSEISYRTVDGNPPSTRIKVVQGKGRLTKVKLTASEANSSFTCRVDTGKPKACPGVLRLHLRPGRHRVAALATDASGNTAAKFVTKKFRVSH